jgi:hypothetical protein
VGRADITAYSIDRTATVSSYAFASNGAICIRSELLTGIRTGFGRFPSLWSLNEKKLEIKGETRYAELSVPLSVN